MDAHEASDILDTIAQTSTRGRFDAAPPLHAVRAARSLANTAYLPLLESRSSAANLVADAVDMLDDALRVLR